MKKDNLEDLFKDSFENFEADVNPTVWKNVQTAVKGASLGLLGKMLLNKLGSSAVISIVSSAAAVIATVFVMNGTKTETKKPEPKTNVVPNVIAEKPTVDEIKTFLTTPEPAKNEVKEPAVAEKKEVVEPKKIENNAPAIKKNKKDIEALLANDRIAYISSSAVSGSVPFIVNVSNLGSGKIDKWTCNDGSKTKVEPNPVYPFDEPGIYVIKLTSTSAEGKVAVDSIRVEAFANSSIVPNQREFSPNGDGVNDIFAFKSSNIIAMSATIYDKKGNIVYEYEGIDGQWDGKNKKGEKASEGTYLYVISATGADGKKYKREGKINLTR